MLTVQLQENRSMQRPTYINLQKLYHIGSRAVKPYASRQDPLKLELDSFKALLANCSKRGLISSPDLHQWARESGTTRATLAHESVQMLSDDSVMARSGTTGQLTRAAHQPQPLGELSAVSWFRRSLLILLALGCIVFLSVYGPTL